MCMEDIRIGRQCGARVNATRTGDGAFVQVCDPDPHRLSVTFYSDTTEHYFVSNSQSTPLGNGISIKAMGEPQKFTVMEYGRFVTDPIYADHEGGGTLAITVLEVSGAPDK